MTKEKALKIIRGKCIEANLSIMDLEVGCLLNCEGEIDRVSWVKGFRYGIGGIGGEFLINELRKDGIKILGRPITLPDVLLAIAQSETNWKEESYGCIQVDLEYKEDYVQLNTNEKGYCRWNLKEPLENQSIETLTFLANLLTNK